MARKNLLKSLLEESENIEKTNSEARIDVSRPRYTKGAIGAVSQSIAALKSRSIIEIDPFHIEAGGVMDRLEHDEVEHKSLMESIRNYGQQVPVLVRPHPEKDDRYQIVYGRRRVLAMRDLGLPVKAMVRDLDDRELVIAQGQENTARKELSFIEKANFARQMRDGGYDRKVMCDALNIDKTVISRMFSIIDRIPVEIVEMIGSAPSIGRDRWLALADSLEKDPIDPELARDLITAAMTDSSDKRFEALIARYTAKTAEKPKASSDTQILRNSKGRTLGRATRNSSKVTLSFKTKDDDGFLDWMIENFDRIHTSWLKTRGE